MNKPTKRWIEKKAENYAMLFSGTTFSDAKGAQAWIKSAMVMAMRDAFEQMENMNITVIEGKPMQDDKTVLL